MRWNWAPRPRNRASLPANRAYLSGGRHYSGADCDLPTPAVSAPTDRASAADAERPSELSPSPSADTAAQMSHAGSIEACIDIGPARPPGSISVCAGSRSVGREDSPNRAWPPCQQVGVIEAMKSARARSLAVGEGMANTPHRAITRLQPTTFREPLAINAAAQRNGEPLPKTSRRSNGRLTISATARCSAMKRRGTPGGYVVIQEHHVRR